MKDHHPMQAFFTQARFFLLIVLVLLPSILTCCRSPEPTPSTTEQQGEKPGFAAPVQSVPPTEPIIINPIVVFEEPNLPSVEEDAKTIKPMHKPEGNTVPGGKKRPRVAIIIDDMGYCQHLSQQLLDLGLNITFSFLPEAPCTAEQENKAFQKGRDILLHLPMEPKDSRWDPGAHALYVRDEATTLRSKMAKMFTAVPHAIGANNHMGSRFTEDAEAMGIVIDTMRQRSLFFIDSYTSAGSRAYAVAQQLGVPTARRQIFLDNIQDANLICRQIELLMSAAKHRGWAIGIGHPNRATLLALTQCSKHLQDEVEIVGAHQLVK